MARKNGQSLNVVMQLDTKPYDAGQGWSVPVTENFVKRGGLASHDDGHRRGK